ncbi:unnamed protein product, partial [Meganyctiphanes norvegica]
SYINSHDKSFNSDTRSIKSHHSDTKSYTSETKSNTSNNRSLNSKASASLNEILVPGTGGGVYRGTLPLIGPRHQQEPPAVTAPLLAPPRKPEIKPKPKHHVSTSSKPSSQTSNKSNTQTNNNSRQPGSNQSSNRASNNNSNRGSKASSASSTVSHKNAANNLRSSVLPPPAPTHAPLIRAPPPPRPRVQDDEYSSFYNRLNKGLDRPDKN